MINRLSYEMFDWLTINSININQHGNFMMINQHDLPVKSGWPCHAMLSYETGASPGAAAGDLGDLVLSSSHGRGGPLQGPRQARGGASTPRAAWEGAKQKKTLQGRQEYPIRDIWNVKLMCLIFMHTYTYTFTHTWYLYYIQYIHMYVPLVVI